jgi:hypothetical protein
MATKIVNRFDKYRRGAAKADFRNLGHAGAVVRKMVAGLVRLAVGPSPPGSPPHTHRQSLKKGVLYAMDGKERVVIGPSVDIAGPSGRPHEFGGEFRGRVYQKRPFVKPGLDKVRGQIPAQWRDSYREE